MVPAHFSVETYIANCHYCGMDVVVIFGGLVLVSTPDCATVAFSEQYT